jgi:hypothetical protein
VQLVLGVLVLGGVGVALGALVGRLPRSYRWLVFVPAFAWIVYAVGLREGWWLELPSTEAWVFGLVFGVVVLAVTAFLGMIVTSSRTRARH